MRKPVVWIACLLGLALLYYATTVKPPAQALPLKARGDAAGKPADATAADPAPEESQRVTVADPDEPAAGTLIVIGQLTSDMAISKDGKHMYMAGPAANVLNIVDIEDDERSSSVAGPELVPQEGDCQDYACVMRGAAGIALSPDEKLAYVSAMEDHAVTVIDLKKQKIVTSIQAGNYPRGIQVSGNGQRAYVFNAKDNSVSALDLVTNTAIGQALPLEGRTSKETGYGLAAQLWLANDDKELWVVDPIMKQLSVVDTGAMKISKNIALGGGNPFQAGAFSAATSTAWIIGAQKLDLINLHTKAIEKTIPLCKEAQDGKMAMNPENTMIAVYDGASVRLLDMRTHKTVGAYPVAGIVSTIRFSPDGKTLYVMSHDGGNLEPDGMALAVLKLNVTLNVAKYIQQFGELFCAPAAAPAAP